jgi:hypothetical protein
MADEEKTETTQPVTEESTIEAFSKASAEVEAQRKEAEASEKATVKPEVREQAEETSEELPEVPVDEFIETDTGLSDEDSEIVSGIDEDVIDVLRDNFDDNEIVEIAKNKPEFLQAIREELDIFDEEEPIKPVEKEIPEPEAEELAAEFEEFKLELDPDIVGQANAKAFEALASRLNLQGKTLAEQRKGLEEQRKKLQAERTAAFNQRIDSCFDRYSKEIFKEAKKAGLKTPKVDLGRSNFFEGKAWKQLTRQERSQIKLRQRLFAHAKTEVELTGVPIEKAIELEIQKELSRGGKKAAAQELIDKLNTEGKRAISRPTRRISQQQGERKFASDYEEAEYRMTKAEQEAGLRA